MHIRKFQESSAPPLVMKQRNIPLFHSEIVFIRLGLYSRGKTFYTPNEEKEDYSACMLRKAKQTLLTRRRRQHQAEVVCQFDRLKLSANSNLNPNLRVVIFAKEMPKNHTDNER